MSHCEGDHVLRRRVGMPVAAGAGADGQGTGEVRFGTGSEGGLLVAHVYLRASPVPERGAFRTVPIRRDLPGHRHPCRHVGTQRLGTLHPPLTPSFAYVIGSPGWRPDGTRRDVDTGIVACCRLRGPSIGTAVAIVSIR